MAANKTEDDDSWLYGNGETPATEEEKESSEQPQNDLNAENNEHDPPVVNLDDTSESFNKEAGELSGEEQEASIILDGDEEEGEESDSDDDDVQVTIKEINTAAGYGSYTTPVNLNITKRVPYAQTGGINQTNSLTVSKSKGVDTEAVGSINGVPVYDYNLDSLEDKPWMKPGADITDYFNYGFQEDTWKLYCEKQKKLRSDLTSGTGLLTVKTGSKEVSANPLPTVNENSKYSGPTATPNVVLTKKAGPPPGRKMSGCIDVIGGGAHSSLASRRVIATPPKESPIQVMTGRTSSGPPTAVMPPGITSMPPPGYMGPPQNLNIPPPGIIAPGMPGVPLGMPPPNLNLSVPPPTFQDIYSYNRFPPPSNQNSSVSHQQNTSSNNKNGEERSQNFDDHYGSISYEERDKEPRRDWSRKDSPSRDRESERYRDSGRDRDRDREKERDRSHSPDDHERRHRDYRDRADYDHERRERRHRERDRDREREDRHRSRRKHRDEEDHDDSGDRHRSSRHKRKRSSRKDHEDGEEADGKDTGESETAAATNDD